jgi:hypothetical protein
MASPEIINISDDDEYSTDDSEVRRAIRIIRSRERHRIVSNEEPPVEPYVPSPPVQDSRPPPVQATTSPAAQATSSTGTLFGGMLLDRKKMEEERLARTQGLKRSADSTPANQPPARKTKTEEKTSMPISKPELSDTRSVSSSQVCSNSFPKGVVRRTWARGYERTGDDIKFEEVLQKDHVQLAILASYQWDDDWLLKKIDINRTRLMCIAYAESEAQVFIPSLPSFLTRYYSLGEIFSGPELLFFSRLLMANLLFHFRGPKEGANASKCPS